MYSLALIIFVVSEKKAFEHFPIGSNVNLCPANCGHLGFLIGIKIRNLVKDIPMIIHLQFGFSQFISFREEDLWNFSQSELIIGPGSHVEYPTGTKNSDFVEVHPKCGSNWPRGFGEEASNVKSSHMTDEGRQVMAIVPMDLSKFMHTMCYSGKLIGKKLESQNNLKVIGGMQPKKHN